MARSFLEQYRSDLESELRSKQFRQAFEKVKLIHPVFKKYPTVEKLEALAQVGNPNYKDKDEVLIILLRELHLRNILYPLINIMFLDSLYRLYGQRRYRVADPPALFSEIQWAFYQTVMSHNIESLPQKVDVNILLNTKKRIIVWEQQNLRNKAEQGELEESCKYLYKDGLTPFDFWKSNIYPEEMESFLLDKVYKKVISHEQYDIIRETLIYKRVTQKEWGDKRGIPEGTVRSLRLRAKTALIEFVEKNKKS